MIKKTLFYAKKLFSDINNPLIYDFIDSVEELSTTYFLKYKLSDMLAHRSQRFYFDENGIPIIPHYIDSSSGDSMHYFPIAIGQMGLAYLHHYNDEHSEESLLKFLNIADWFVDNQTNDGFWLANTNVDKFHLKAPWKSAMAQSRGVSVLVRAYNLTKNEKYLNSADKAFITLIDVNQEISMDFHGRFYLEYPSIKPPKVLNGFIFSMYGIYDYALARNNTEAFKIFNECCTTLKTICLLYDTGSWTSYDLNHLDFKEKIRPCTVHYQFIHINQLKTIFIITQDPYFLDIANRWEYYYKNKLNLISIYFKKARGILKI